MTKTHHIPRGWSEHEVELVRAALARGETASSIARQLRGRSRNAILGLSYRNGWTKGRVASTPRFVRAAPVRRSMIGTQHSFDGSAPITLAGPVWSHPANARPAYEVAA